MPADQAEISMINFSFIRNFISALLLLCIPNFILAGSFSITPLKIDLSRSESTRIIHLQNLESKPVTVQLQAMAWSHNDGVDHFLQTRDVLVTPQIFHLKANGLQIIRVGLIRKPDAAEEMSYRLFIEEIPEPPARDFKGVQLALKVSVPIFIAPDKTSRPVLEFHTAMQQDGKLKIKIINSGQMHTQIQKIAVLAEENSEQLIASFEKSLYVLPGQERHLLLKTDGRDFSANDKFFIKATTRNGQVDSYAIAGPP